MSSQPDTDDHVVITDGRQSPTAAAVQRGTSRMLYRAGFASVCELTLSTRRRADILAINTKGEIWIVEIKSSPADYMSDHKWREYMDYCDRFFFAIPADMDPDLIDTDAGLIIADAYGAEIMRSSEEAKLSPARRKAVTLLTARTTALRLQFAADPKALGKGL